jgi:hypothetical protein
MSKELADQFERDLSASDETAERARQARTRGRDLDTDWVRALGVYRAQANTHPDGFVRSSGSNGELPEPVLRHYSREYPEAFDTSRLLSDD